MDKEALPEEMLSAIDPYASVDHNVTAIFNLVHGIGGPNEDRFRKFTAIADVMKGNGKAHEKTDPDMAERMYRIERKVREQALKILIK